MPKPDYAHELTDEELEALERRISAEYGKAAKELQKKIDDYFAKFEKRDAELKKKLDAGEITEDYYKQWRIAQIGRGERFEALRDRVAERMTKANETAAAYINDATPGLYSLNRNYAAYTIEQVAGDVGFDLWDEQTVKRLIVEQPDLMPYYPPERAVKRGIDLAWGKQQITAQVTSGILQGESIKHLSDRLQKNIPGMNRTSAIRAARTAVTGAQNAGRMDSYVAAQKMGIDLEREWVATLDGRTRHEHAKMDGQKAPIDKPFVMDGYKIMYPGDMSAPGYLVYNCRCTVIAAVKGVDTSDAKRWARDPVTGQNVLIEDMTYSEWAGWKKSLQEGHERGIINDRSMALGMRKPASYVLTDDEIESVKADAKFLNIEENLLRFNTGGRTGFSDDDGLINVCGDILPDLSSKSARDRMSQRAVLAHEYYGHFINHPSEYDIGDWRDEFRASYDAAVNAPNLSDEDRAYLMIDAYDRAREAGQMLNYDEIAKRIIYGY